MISTTIVLQSILLFLFTVLTMRYVITCPISTVEVSSGNAWIISLVIAVVLVLTFVCGSVYPCGMDGICIDVSPQIPIFPL